MAEETLAPIAPAYDPLLDLVVSNGIIDQQQAEELREEHTNTGHSIRQLLIDNGFVGEDDLLGMMAAYQGCDVVDLGVMVPADRILKTAIEREIAAYQLYTDAAQMVEAEHVKGALEDLAAQEVGHRRRLEGLLEGRGGAGYLNDAIRPLAVGQLPDFLGKVILIRRKGMVRPQRQGQFAPFAVEVRDDYRDRPVEGRQLGGEDAEQPQPDHHHGFAQLEPELADALQRHRGDHHERRVQQLDTVVIDHGQAGCFLDGVRTVTGEVRQGAVADPGVFDPFAHSDHPSDATISGIVGKLHRGVRQVQQVGPFRARADHGVVVFQENFPRFGLPDLEFLEHRPADRFEDDVVSGHRYLLPWVLRPFRVGPRWRGK